MDATHYIAIAIAILTAGAAILAARGKAKYARIIRAVIQGVEAGAASLNTETGKNLKRGIAAEASKLGVQAALHAVVRRVTRGP